MSSSILRPLRSVRKDVHPLGLALAYGIDEKGFEYGVERGLNYFFWTRFRTSALVPALKRTLAKDRERRIVATGPSFGYFRGSIRRRAEAALRTLGTDYIDIFQLFWLGKMSALSDGNLEELLKLKEEGKVRAIGISIHDRERAGELVRTSPLDLFMLRYNAAHPGAERDIFPHLEARKPSVIAYTATDWRKLLKAPSGWDGRPMTAGECYRFCLSNPNVDVVLTGPKNQKELEENIDAAEAGPLSKDELDYVRAFGKAVHG